MSVQISVTSQQYQIFNKLDFSLSAFVLSCAIKWKLGSTVPAFARKNFQIIQNKETNVDRIIFRENLLKAYC
jgi:hypothetical protein